MVKLIGNCDLIVIFRRLNVKLVIVFLTKFRIINKCLNSATKRYICLNKVELELSGIKKVLDYLFKWTTLMIPIRVKLPVLQTVRCRLTVSYFCNVMMGLVGLRKMMALRTSVKREH